MKLTISILAVLIAMAVAVPSHKFKYMNNKLRPQEWFSTNDLESMPSLDDLTLQTLEKMPAEKGSYLLRKFYHLAQMKYDLQPAYVPSPSNIPVTIYKEDGSKVKTNFNQLLETVQQIPNFGQEEVTIFITGLPEVTDSVLKANNALIQAYKWRYNGNKSTKNMPMNYQQNGPRTSSEEEFPEMAMNEQTTRGNLIVIDLGASINNMKRYALLDVEQTGNMIAKILVQLTSETNMPHEIIHIVAQGISSHVAGAAGRQYTRLTGQKLRRITALDPSKIMSVYPERLTGLARGDAEFVDAIHTNTEGMGTRQRVGNADFYPNGPSATMPGANNVVEASMRATRYYAETVRPGNERNFPAVPATSLDEYNQKNGYGKRAYMGLDADFDLEGDYILEVNAISPFGRRNMAEKQNTYHGVHNTYNNYN